MSGTTTQFTWDGMGGDLLQQYDGTTKTSFIYGPNGSPVEQVAGSTATYLHHDQLGSTRLLTDSTGSALTATTITYDAYGNTASTVGTLTTPLLWGGQYKDTEGPGLYYLRARYYDPSTAQFLSRDPLVAVTRSPYGYVNGDPLDHTDPTGLCGWTDPFGCISDAAGAAGGWIKDHGEQIAKGVAIAGVCVAGGEAICLAGAAGAVSNAVVNGLTTHENPIDSLETASSEARSAPSAAGPWSGVAAKVRSRASSMQQTKGSGAVMCCDMAYSGSLAVQAVVQRVVGGLREKAPWRKAQAPLSPAIC